MKIAIAYAAGSPPQSVALVHDALQSHGHAVTRVGFGDVDQFARAISGGDAEGPTRVVVNLVGGPAAPAFAGLLDLLGVPYTGSALAALSLAQDSHRAKAVMLAHGVRVVDGWLAVAVDGYAVVTPDDALRFDPSDFPLAVNRTVVRDPDALVARVKSALVESGPVLVEVLIEGREFHVSVLGSGDDARVLPPVEVVPESVDDDPDAALTSPPDDYPDAMSEEVAAQAVRAFRAVGCRDYATVDVRVDADGKAYVMDVHPNPDMSDDADIMRSAQAQGMSPDELIETIVQFAAARGEREEV